MRRSISTTTGIRWKAAQALARYRRHYNWERPHQALDYGVPGEIYCARTEENTKLLEAQKCLT